MEKNYYEILEINKNASPEIIEKAYKTLVKKYHPDLQEDHLKNKYEEKIKVINEAYEILSKPEKREKYNLNLKEISEIDYNNLYNENLYLKDELNNLKNNYTHNLNTNTTQNYKNINQNYYDEKINDAINKAYHDAYIQDLKNRGYKIHYKKTVKDFMALLITILIIFIIGFIIWHIPFTKNHLINMYNNNFVFKNLVDFILNFF